MKWTRATVAFLAADAVIVAALALTASLPATSSPSNAKKMIARGEYLAGIMSCNDCHTPGTFYGAPDASRRLSGSELGWQGPWGVTYPRNLTPDMETGLGKWSEKDIIKALRTGMRPDGSILQPPMPWTNFVKLSDDDVMALAMYIKSLPPVSHKVPDRILPGQPVTGAVMVIPPPPAWDAPKTPPEAAPAPAPGGTK
jgi:mono/diheme cytochrome c family protein